MYNGNNTPSYTTTTMKVVSLKKPDFFHLWFIAVCVAVRMRGALPPLPLRTARSSQSRLSGHRSCCSRSISGRLPLTLCFGNILSDTNLVSVTGHPTAGRNVTVCGGFSEPAEPPLISSVHLAVVSGHSVEVSVRCWRLFSGWMLFLSRFCSGDFSSLLAQQRFLLNCRLC